MHLEWDPREDAEVLGKKLDSSQHKQIKNKMNYKAIHWAAPFKKFTGRTVVDRETKGNEHIQQEPRPMHNGLRVRSRCIDSRCIDSKAKKQTDVEI